MLPCLLDGIIPVHSLAHNLNINLGMQKLANRATNAFIVIYHEHAKGVYIHTFSGEGGEKPYADVMAQL